MQPIVDTEPPIISRDIFHWSESARAIQKWEKERTKHKSKVSTVDIQIKR